jgi:hypothetical protein
MSYVRIDTDRGALYGKTFDETLTHFFGQHQGVTWDCHQLAAGYINGRQALSTSVRVEHRGHWVIAARIFGTADVEAIPVDAVCSGRGCAIDVFDGPTMPRWVYEWAQRLLL